jgi:hypothetical protein
LWAVLSTTACASPVRRWRGRLNAKITLDANWRREEPILLLLTPANRSNRPAGERGGARVGRPRWGRILTITGGASMAAIHDLLMV